MLVMVVPVLAVVVGILVGCGRMLLLLVVMMKVRNMERGWGSVVPI